MFFIDYIQKKKVNKKKEDIQKIKKIDEHKDHKSYNIGFVVDKGHRKPIL